MPEPKRRNASFFLPHVVLLATLLLPGGLCAAAGNAWVGVDEAVVEKIAGAHGRASQKPLIDLGEGDLLLFAFLCAGAVGGFAAGYYWRDLVAKK